MGAVPYFRCPYIYVTTHLDCIRKITLKFLEEYILSEVQQHIEQIINDKNKKYNFNILQYIEMTSLNKELVDMFIDKIVVHKKSNIEIIWKSINMEYKQQIGDFWYFIKD